MSDLLDLDGAAKFLKMNREVLRRKAFTGEIPGAKPGRSWVFIVDDLIGYIRSKYTEVKSCRSGKEKVSGKPASLHLVDKEYAARLGLDEKKKRKNLKGT